MLRDHRLVRGVLAAGCTAVVAAAAAAGPAQAASPFVRDTALCPTGKVTVGGGTQVVGAGTGDFRTNMLESAPGTIGGGAQSLWLTAMRNDSGTTRTIGLFTVCASTPSGYEVVRKDTVVPAGGFLRSTAICPTNKVALAGGMQVVGAGTADFRTRMQESAPGTINGGAQSLWLVAMRNYDSVAHTVGIFAVCGYRPYGYEVVRKDTFVPAGGFLRSTANCPSGKVVMGGGTSVVGEGTADLRTRMQENAPGTTGSPSVSVHLSAVRNYDSKAHTIALHAVCAPAPYGYQVVRKDVAIG
jgi:hypothetical protein